MRRSIVVLTLLCATASAGVAWETDLNKARLRAAREDKLLFINFTADW